ncbi:MAG: inositol monophosphatase family protein [Jhaorihella sp.]
MSIAAIRDTATAIARSAGEVAMAHFRTPLQIDAKADESPVTRADRETEAHIRAALAREFPGHGILGEEYGVSGSLEGDTWVIDPIDGTRSFITGNPLFGLLMAYLSGGVPRLGLVHMPALGETYIGASGLGAARNGVRIRCRDTASLDHASVYINEAERVRTMDGPLFDRLCGIGRTRRMSYDCYPYALLASGQIDAVVDCGLEPYDYLPLVGLIEAAGGVITDWQGGALTLRSDGRVAAAATRALHGALLEVLGG